MRRLKNKLRNFMYKRYGADELYIFLFEFYIIMLIINLFANSKLLTILELLIVFIMFYRFFSLKKDKRVKENKLFLKWQKKILKPWHNIKRNFRDRDYYLYKKCSSCHATLKLPLPFRRGLHHVKCPKCGRRLTVFTVRKEKQEVIKKKEKMRV